MDKMKELPPYWQRHRDAKIANTLSAKLLRERRSKLLSDFYNRMALFSPANCQNCDANLLATVLFHPRAHMAHILPKEHFKSVETEKLIIWFACLECHKFYDEQPAEKVAKMNIIPLLKQRVKKLYKKIKQDERKRIPFYLQPGSED